MPVQPEPQEPTGSSRRGRGSLVVLLVSGAVVLLLAGGGFAAWRLLAGGGAQPADVLPADTLGVVSVDLDPSGGQKIEAIQTLRKFPAFREEVGLESDDDVVQALFERLQAEEDVCPDVDYAEDVKPWLGQRFAVAALPGDDEPTPVGVVQVTDADAARDGIEALQACGDTGDQAGGLAFGDDYVVIAETDEIAEQALADGQEDPLSGDDAYQRWTDEAGGDGIVEMYAAAEAAELFGELAAQGGQDTEGLEEQLEDFEGAAASLRFDDGVVLSFASSAAGAVGDAPLDQELETLPDDTAALLALGVSEETRDRIREATAPGQPGATDDLLGQVEGALGSVGLSFPDDVLTLLGDSLSLSVGGEAPASEPTGPQDVPAGLRVQGDAAEIQDILDRVEQASGLSLESQGVVVESDDDTVAMSFQPAYAESLLEGEGSLLDSEAFESVVPEGEQATAVLYLHLTDSWRELVTSTVDDPELEDNLAPLRAFGISGWVDGDVARGEARLSLN
ncbi:DUF3352 domain-containing protein [Nocardioides aequoreus]|uniref:DUF3352 domain-containing protein n=1 Tax=Nocardioides aequoreus TaxID=397278 RepID=UPI0014707F20|nr:DUF3352 domain-containing protein [Nocardioides aequoreus]